MKRIASACTCQTLHFILDPSLSVEEAKKRVKEEVKLYQETMKDKIKIVSLIENSDGTYILELKKIVSGYPIGKYFD